ncbi:MAG: MerR family transcriptional regulator [Actinobacteria bacterium]|nr:MerR family transcriptional regulator [Actinomycetota bacterium]
MNAVTPKSKTKTAAKGVAAAANNGAATNELTIDQLAQRSGMTVRNIRAHQSRGLLPAPNVKGRIGYYDDRHVARLELIQQLQSGGFNLTAIQRLVERAEQTGDAIGNLRSLVLMPFAHEQSEVMTLEELAQQLGAEIDARLIKKGIELGFVLPLDNSRFEVISPTIMRAAVQCIQLGVPLDMLLGVLKAVNIHSRAIADAFTKMVDEGIIRPVERDGLPPESFPIVMAAIESLRPLAAEVAMAGFHVNMDNAAEDAFGKILRRIAKEDLRLPEEALAKTEGGKVRGTVTGAAKGAAGAVKSAAKVAPRAATKDAKADAKSSEKAGAKPKRGSAGRRRGRVSSGRG